MSSRRKAPLPLDASDSDEGGFFTPKSIHTGHLRVRSASLSIPPPPSFSTSSLIRVERNELSGLYEEWENRLKKRESELLAREELIDAKILDVKKHENTALQQVSRMEQESAFKHEQEILLEREYGSRLASVERREQEVEALLLRRENEVRLAMDELKSQRNELLSVTAEAQTVSSLRSRVIADSEALAVEKRSIAQQRSLLEKREQESAQELQRSSLDIETLKREVVIERELLRTKEKEFSLREASLIVERDSFDAFLKAAKQALETDRKVFENEKLVHENETQRVQNSLKAEAAAAAQELNEARDARAALSIEKRDLELAIEASEKASRETSRQLSLREDAVQSAEAHVRKASEELSCATSEYDQSLRRRAETILASENAMLASMDVASVLCLELGEALKRLRSLTLENDKAQHQHQSYHPQRFLQNDFSADDAKMELSMIASDKALPYLHEKAAYLRSAEKISNEISTGSKALSDMINVLMSKAKAAGDRALALSSKEDELSKHQIAISRETTALERVRSDLEALNAELQSKQKRIEEDEASLADERSRARLVLDRESRLGEWALEIEKEKAQLTLREEEFESRERSIAPSLLAAERAKASAIVSADEASAVATAAKIAAEESRRVCAMSEERMRAQEAELSQRRAAIEKEEKLLHERLLKLDQRDAHLKSEAAHLIEERKAHSETLLKERSEISLERVNATAETERLRRESMRAAELASDLKSRQAALSDSMSRLAIREKVVMEQEEEAAHGTAQARRLAAEAELRASVVAEADDRLKSMQARARENIEKQEKELAALTSHLEMARAQKRDADSQEELLMKRERDVESQQTALDKAKTLLSEQVKAFAVKEEAIVSRLDRLVAAEQAFESKRVSIEQALELKSAAAEQALESRRTALEASEKRLSEAETKIFAAAKALDVRESGLNDREVSLTDAEEQIRRAHSLIKRDEDKLAMSAARLARAESACEELESNARKALMRAEDMERGVVLLKSSLEKEREDVDRRNVHLQQQTAALQASQEAARADRLTHEAALSAQAQALASATEEAQRHQSAQSDRLSSLHAELTEAREGVKSAREAFEKESHQRSADYERKRVELEEREEAVILKESVLAKKESSLSSLRNSIEGREKNVKEEEFKLREAQSECVTELARAEAELRKAATAAEDAKTRLDMATRREEEAIQAEEKAKRRHIDLDTRDSVLQAMKAASEQALNEAHLESEENKRRAKQLEEMNDEAVAQLQRVAAERAVAHEAAMQTEAVRAQLAAQLEDKATLDRLRQEANDFKARASSEFQRVASDKAKAAEELVSLEKDRADLREERASIRRDGDLLRSRERAAVELETKAMRLTVEAEAMAAANHRRSNELTSRESELTERESEFITREGALSNRERSLATAETALKAKTAAQEDTHSMSLSSIARAEADLARSRENDAITHRELEERKRQLDAREATATTRIRQIERREAEVSRAEASSKRAEDSASEAAKARARESALSSKLEREVAERAAAESRESAAVEALAEAKRELARLEESFALQARQVAVSADEAATAHSKAAAKLQEEMIVNQRHAADLRTREIRLSAESSALAAIGDQIAREKENLAAASKEHKVSLEKALAEEVNAREKAHRLMSEADAKSRAVAASAEALARDSERARAESIRIAEAAAVLTMRTTDLEEREQSLRRRESELANEANRTASSLRALDVSRSDATEKSARIAEREASASAREISLNAQSERLSAESAALAKRAAEIEGAQVVAEEASRKANRDADAARIAAEAAKRAADLVTLRESELAVQFQRLQAASTKHETDMARLASEKAAMHAEADEFAKKLATREREVDAKIASMVDEVTRFEIKMKDEMSERDRRLDIVAKREAALAVREAEFRSLRDAAEKKAMEMTASIEKMVIASSSSLSSSSSSLSSTLSTSGLSTFKPPTGAEAPSLSIADLERERRLIADARAELAIAKEEAETAARNARAAEAISKSTLLESAVANEALQSQLTSELQLVASRSIELEKQLASLKELQEAAKSAAASSNVLSSIEPVTVPHLSSSSSSSSPFLPPPVPVTRRGSKGGGGAAAAAATSAAAAVAETERRLRAHSDLVEASSAAATRLHEDASNELMNLIEREKTLEVRLSALNEDRQTFEREKATLIASARDSARKAADEVLAAETRAAEAELAVVSLRTRLAAAEEEAETGKASVRVLSEHAKAMEVGLSAAEAKLRDVREDLNLKEERVKAFESGLSSENSALFNEIETLRVALDSEKAHRDRLLDSLNSEKNAIRLASEKERGEYEAALVSIRSQENGLRLRLKDVMDASRTFEQRVLGLEDQLRSEEAKWEEREASYKHLLLVNDEELGKAQNLVMTLQSEKTGLEEDVKRLNEEALNDSGVVSVLKRKFQAERDEAEKQIQALRGELDEALATSENRIYSSQSAAEERVLELQTRLSEAQIQLSDVVASLQEARREASVKAEAVAIVATECEKLKAELRSSDVELSELKKELSLLKKKLLATAASIPKNASAAAAAASTSAAGSRRQSNASVSQVQPPHKHASATSKGSSTQGSVLTTGDASPPLSNSSSIVSSIVTTTGLTTTVSPPPPLPHRESPAPLASMSAGIRVQQQLQQQATIASTTTSQPHVQLQQPQQEDLSPQSNTKRSNHPYVKSLSAPSSILSPQQQQPKQDKQSTSTTTTNLSSKEPAKLNKPVAIGGRGGGGRGTLQHQTGSNNLPSLSLSSNEAAALYAAKVTRSTSSKRGTSAENDQDHKYERKSSSSLSTASHSVVSEKNKEEIEDVEEERGRTDEEIDARVLQLLAGAESRISRLEAVIGRITLSSPPDSCSPLVSGLISLRDELKTAKSDIIFYSVPQGNSESSLQTSSSSSSSLSLPPPGRVAHSKLRLSKFEQNVKVLMSQASMFLASQKIATTEANVGGVNYYDMSSRQSQQVMPQTSSSDGSSNNSNIGNGRRNSIGYQVVAKNPSSSSSSSSTSSSRPKVSSSDRGPSPSLQQHADRFDALSAKMNRSIEERDRLVQSLPKPDEFSLSLLDGGGDSMINNTSAISTASSYRGSRLANVSNVSDSNAAAAAYAALISQRSSATRAILQESRRDHLNMSAASNTDRELLDSVFASSDLAVGAISSIALASSEIGGVGNDSDGGFRDLSSPPAPVRVRGTIDKEEEEENNGGSPSVDVVINEEEEAVAGLQAMAMSSTFVLSPNPVPSTGMQATAPLSAGSPASFIVTPLSSDVIDGKQQQERSMFMPSSSLVGATSSGKVMLTSSTVDAFTRTAVALDEEALIQALRAEVMKLEKELEAFGDASEAMKNKALWFKRQAVVAELATKRNELIEAISEYQ